MIRVMIAEDVRLLRESLAAVLELEDDLTVVATVERGDEILDAAARALPDVALLDIDLPGLDGISGAGQLRERLPDCRTVILTGLSRPGHLRRALTAGASGFLLKHSVPQTLIDAIRKVAAGERVVDPAARAGRAGDSGQPVARTGDRRAAAGRDRRRARRDRRDAIPQRGYRAQLPLVGDHPTRRAQPGRRDPHRDRPGLAVAARRDEREADRRRPGRSAARPGRRPGR